jgi:hypothetical protein
VDGWVYWKMRWLRRCDPLRCPRRETSLERECFRTIVSDGDLFEVFIIDKVGDISWRFTSCVYIVGQGSRG